MEFKIFSDTGLIRNNNEDNYLLKLEPYPLFVVADGMGGHQGGDVASKIAVETIEDFHFNNSKSFLSTIKKAIKKANKNIMKEGQNNPSLTGMGTTLSLGLIYNNILYIGHVGDSRIYHFSNGDLKRVTTDDSLVNKLINQGKISPEEAFKHPQKHVLTQALGTEIRIDIETKKIELYPGDILLSCTDGLTDMIREQEMKNIIKNNYNNLEKLVEKLGNQALKNGGRDNITLIAGIIN